MVYNGYRIVEVLKFCEYLIFTILFSRMVSLNGICSIFLGPKFHGSMNFVEFNQLYVYVIVWVAVARINCASNAGRKLVIV